MLGRNRAVQTRAQHSVVCIPWLPQLLRLLASATVTARLWSPPLPRLPAFARPWPRLLSPDHGHAHGGGTTMMTLAMCFCLPPLSLRCTSFSSSPVSGSHGPHSCKTHDNDGGYSAVPFLSPRSAPSISGPGSGLPSLSSRTW